MEIHIPKGQSVFFFSYSHFLAKPQYFSRMSFFPRTLARWTWALVLSPLSIVSCAILFSIGWSGIKIPERTRLSKHNRMIGIFSHTSYVDFYILLLYILSYPYELFYLRTLMKPQPFQYAGWLLNKFGAIPATKVDDRNGGSVERIVQQLRQSEKFLFLISPKGTIVKSPWRSGYYHIARKLDAHILVTGLDYERKEALVLEPIAPGEKEEDVKQHLVRDLARIVPLFPEEEVVETRKHDVDLRGPISYDRLLGVVAAILLLLQLTSPTIALSVVIIGCNVLFTIGGER